jgi:localization factor PodJL
MNSRVSWSVDGIDPSVRERAEAAARRAGMSLNDWLNSSIGEAVPPNFQRPADARPQAPSRESRDVADIHQRLDSITRQIEQISKPAPRQEQGGVARQLNDAISRLDARLSQISNPLAGKAHSAQDRPPQTEAVERAASQVYANPGYANPGYHGAGYAAQPAAPQEFGRQPGPAYRASPPLSPASLDSAIAEIAARQNELDDVPSRALPPRYAPPVAPEPAPYAAPPPGPDFSALERHLFKITSQIEALQRPDGIEQSIQAFRGELAEIRQAITEAMPRRAIESIENEVRSLARRIDDNRQCGFDSQALASVERALGEIREVLRSLTPAEQLAGYDEAIRNLGGKIDMLLRASDDPGTMQQLEGAIAALRAVVSNVASTDALARLSDDVHLLSSKVDQLTRGNDHSDSFAALEQRIATLTTTLENRERPRAAADGAQPIEEALRALSERIDRLQVGGDGASAFAHLEQRVSYLLERLEASSDPRAGHLGRVEEGLQDIRRHLEEQHARFAAFADNNRGAAPAQDPGLIDIVKRELSDLRFNQSKTDRQTQDSLEAVHSTLGHVVDRLAMIEGDLRTVRPAPTPSVAPAAVEPPPAPARVALPPQPKPELPNPAAAQAAFAAAPREFHAASSPPPLPAAASVAPRAISEILEPHAAAPAARPALDSNLPPDHPLEPGTRPNGRVATPTERIAASESAISELPAPPREPVSSSSFIAAARRAAQAAAAQPADKSGQSAAKNDKGKGKEKDKAAPKIAAPADAAKASSSVTSKIRSLLVGASVVVIVLGTFKLAMTLLDSGTPPAASVETSNQPQAPVAAPSDNPARPATPDQVTPSMTSPTPIGRQSLNNSIPNGPDTALIEIPQGNGDVTGAIPGNGAATRRPAMVAIPPSEKLPDAIGGPVLRAAALRGDPTAAYEVGVRFAEGKGVAQNIDEAVKWYDRAAQAGIVPAIFRLGTLYEKGLSVKRDPDIARRYYLQAAERGSAKAMHNLAVLDADGGGKGANYQSAAQWFRKAADRGVADSQFNLGILYARGIGVEQNLAESFKWFSLAAGQGDADSAHKRDDIAKRLDPQSLAAAKLAIQTFSAEPQPDDAVNVATPPGGWDSAPASASTRPAAKPALTKRAAR